MSERAAVAVVILAGGALLTFARRWNNTDADAGSGIAGWTIFLVLASLYFDALTG